MNKRVKQLEDERSAEHIQLMQLQEEKAQLEKQVIVGFFVSFRFEILIFFCSFTTKVVDLNEQSLMKDVEVENLRKSQAESGQVRLR